MNDNIIFEQIPGINSLFMEQVLFSFENIPMIFVCVDSSQSRYLCVCDDIIEEQSWIISKIQNSTLLRILNDEITVLNAFKDKDVWVATKKAGQDMMYQFVQYNHIDIDELPLCDQYLEMKESLGRYIDLVSIDASIENLARPYPMSYLTGIQSIAGSLLLDLLSKDEFEDDKNMFLNQRFETIQLKSSFSMRSSRSIDTDEMVNSTSANTSFIPVECTVIEELSYQGTAISVLAA